MSFHDCMNWKGVITTNGYGRIWLGETEYIYAHRLAFQSAFGYLPEFVLHLCNNKPCVNPSHLYDGTKSDNAFDAAAIGAISNPQPGELNGRAKLNRQKVARLRKLRSEGSTYKYLGKLFGIHMSQARRIVIGEQWK